jgi:hypothetical protein
MIVEAGVFPVLNTPKMNSLSPNVAAATAEEGGIAGNGTSAHGFHV